MQKYEFRDAEFMSAREKTMVLKAWVRFLKSGLRWEAFSEGLYTHLHLHCSFTTHRDRAGFYAAYFENGEDNTSWFLSQFDKRGECRSVEYGGLWWLGGDYMDVNTAMIDEAVTFIPALLEQASDKA